ncbi:hypothetical protein ACFW2Y_14075 [Streptomyces sp. NPDC058877]|uniref:hypothetical protein n=1 Tax=unclassified Streptomyces TaxID=2593676 RepID=UPI0036B9384F
MSIRIRRGLMAVTAVTGLVLGTSSCVDNRTAPPPPPVKVRLADLQGTWSGWEGSTLTLGPNGQAKATDLDGQEFRFDDNWRMTGQGTWELYEPGRYKGGNMVGRGYVVHVTVKSAARAPSPSSSPADASGLGPSATPSDASARTALPPAEATWYMGVTKGKSGRPALFFLTSDPDARDTYTLSKG